MAVIFVDLIWVEKKRRPLIK